MYFDTHAHYDDEMFDGDREWLLDRALPESGVALVLNPGCERRSSLFAVELSEKYDYVYAAAGWHPSDAESFDESSETLIRELCGKKKVRAIGEIGLDYHYEKESRLQQLALFEAQLAFAKERELPVIVHDREAHEDTLRLLQKYRPRGVVHCFSGSAETAREVLKLGMYIGLGGAVTFKNAVKPVEVAKMVPADRLLVETDAPYMAPVPCRGKRCDSRMIAYTAERLAEIRGVDAQDLLHETARNARALFGLRAEK